MLKRNQLIIIFTTIIMLASLVTVVTTQNNNPDKNFYRNKLILATDCMTSKDPINPFNSKKYNTNTDKSKEIMPFQRILCAIDIYGQPKNLNQLDLMISTLIEYSKDDPYIRNICHDVLHEMGLKAWNKYEEKILKTNYFSCGMGFIHGAFSQAFSDPSNQSKNLTLLSEFCDEVSLKDKNKNDSCFHGIGHGIGNQNYSISKQLEICEQVKSKINNIRLLTSCLSGSFNQFFYLKTVDNSGDIKNSISYCDSLINTEILECYKFALMYTNLSGAELKNYCDSIKDNIKYKTYKYYGCYEAAAMSFIHNELYSSLDTGGYDVTSNVGKILQYTNNLCGEMSLLANEEVLNLSKSDQKITNELGKDAERYYQSYFKYNSCLFRFYSELYEKVLNYENFKAICRETKLEENEICTKISEISKTVNYLEKPQSQI